MRRPTLFTELYKLFKTKHYAIYYSEEWFNDYKYELYPGKIIGIEKDHSVQNRTGSISFLFQTNEPIEKTVKSGQYKGHKVVRMGILYIDPSMIFSNRKSAQFALKKLNKCTRTNKGV